MGPVEVQRPFVRTAHHDGRHIGGFQLAHSVQQVIPGGDLATVDARLGEQVLVVHEADLRDCVRQAIELAVEREGGDGGGVDVPYRALIGGAVGDGGRVEHGEGQRGVGPAGGAAWGEPLDADGERVAGFGAFDEEGAGHRVRPFPDLDFVGIEAGCVDGVGDDGVAIGNSEAGLGGADRVVIAGWAEAMRGHWGPPGKRRGQARKRAWAGQWVRFTRRSRRRRCAGRRSRPRCNRLRGAGRWCVRPGQGPR